VNTLNLPLIFISGPSQNVWTTKSATTTWFANQLASKEEQSSKYGRHGLLVGIQLDTSRTEDTATFTEVLFYAESLVTHKMSEEEAAFCLKAVPLCSETPSYLPSPPLPPVATGQDSDAQFLPSLGDLRSAALAKEKMRRQVSGVFDEATERKRKARRKGGEGVAAAAAQQNDGINVLVGHKKSKAPAKSKAQTISQIAPKQLMEQNSTSTLHRSHSRRESISSHAHEQPRRILSRSPSITSDTRPASRTGALEGMNKRSSLSRVSSLNETATTEERNKDAISRLVMAGMRLYGLQQRKRTNHSRRISEINIQMSVNSSDATAKEDATKDEEYKLIYHQTYKGTVFAFVGAICAFHAVIC
jgi:hypothetical protein